MRRGNLAAVGMMVAIAGALVLLTDGATPWKAVVAWMLWAAGLGIALRNGRLQNG